VELREGVALLERLERRCSPWIRPRALARWAAALAQSEPGNTHREDIAAALHELAQDSGRGRMPVAEVVESLHEVATELRRSGRDDALKLMTAHAAKGLEFDHVVVMDCADWRWDADDERRLLYVAMTRARHTLTVLRAEGGRNAYLTDLSTLEGVAELLPAERPRHRPELDRRVLALGPADVDLGWAGRKPPAHPVHMALARLRVGDALHLRGRELVAGGGQAVGRLAARVEQPPGAWQGVVTGVMVRERRRTAPEFRDALACERWEVVLAELRQQA
jgi:ATP-dependent DNA helicase RecQ